MTITRLLARFMLVVCRYLTSIPSVRESPTAYREVNDLYKDLEDWVYPSGRPPFYGDRGLAMLLPC